MRLVAVSWRELANPSAGGAEVLLDQLLNRLAQRGHHVALVCGGPSKPRPYRVIDAGGTYSHYLWAPLICMIRYRRADLLIDVENGVPYFSPLWRRRPSVCLVHHVHSDQWRTRFPRPVAAVMRVVESRAMPFIYRNRTFVAISTSTAKALEEIGVDPARIHVIEPGIDSAPQIDGSKSDEPLFVSLCRVVPHKRVDLLLEAWKAVSRDIPGRLLIAGDGPELERIRDMASRIPRVEVLGRITEEEKWNLLHQSWAHVSASHHEGWGLTTLEAAVVGTPTLALDAPGVRDAIVADVTGVLVEASDENAAPALARAWIDLAQNAERRQQLGRAAQERTIEFGWDPMVDRWLKLIVEVVAEPRGSGRKSHRSVSSEVVSDGSA